MKKIFCYVLVAVCSFLFAKDYVDFSIEELVDLLTNETYYQITNSDNLLLMNYSNLKFEKVHSDNEVKNNLNITREGYETILIIDNRYYAFTLIKATVQKKNKYGPLYNGIVSWQLAPSKKNNDGVDFYDMSESYSELHSKLKAKENVYITTELPVVEGFNYDNGYYHSNKSFDDIDYEKEFNNQSLVLSEIFKTSEGVGFYVNGEFYGLYIVLLNTANFNDFGRSLED